MLCCLFSLQGIFILLLYYVCLFLFPALAFTFSLLGSSVAPPVARPLVGKAFTTTKIAVFAALRPDQPASTAAFG
ncbi:hypothetical protein BJX68DRAFT_229579 [Aspergillus pseudodeflectus]|uniref:Secreted protein n=1 Tax=Aspergillus pseudodeflectus TaxID=176178 RepID=A0ABR4L075_9EURO